MFGIMDRDGSTLVEVTHMSFSFPIPPPVCMELCIETDDLLALILEARDCIEFS